MSENKCPHCKETVFAWDYSKDYADEMREEIEQLKAKLREVSPPPTDSKPESRWISVEDFIKEPRARHCLLVSGGHLWLTRYKEESESFSMMHPLDDWANGPATGLVMPLYHELIAPPK